MLRLGTPVRNSWGEKSAVLILNYLADNLFKLLAQASRNRTGSLYMLNQAGFGLMAPHERELWGFQLPTNKPYNFNQKYAEAWGRIKGEESGQFYTGQGLFSFDTLVMPLPTAFYHDRKNQTPKEAGPGIKAARWKLVQFIPNPTIKNLIEGRGNFVMILAASAALILLGASWWIGRILVTRRLGWQALLEARAQAEAANEAKGQFLASMSHEIRTPMNASIGLSGLTLKMELPAKQRDYLNKIHSSAKVLLGILNDILDFSKIEAGKLDMEHITFNLEETLQNVANLLGERAIPKIWNCCSIPTSKFPRALSAILCA